MEVLEMERTTDVRRERNDGGGLYFDNRPPEGATGSNG